MTYWPGPLIKSLLFLLLWSNLYYYVREIKPMQKKPSELLYTAYTDIFDFQFPKFRNGNLRGFHSSQEFQLTPGLSLEPRWFTFFFLP